MDALNLTIKGVGKMEERFTNVLLGALEGVRSRTMEEEQKQRMTT